VIAYGCRIGSEHRFRRWAGLGFSRVMHPEDLSALAEETGTLAEAWDEIIAAMRERPDCEAVVLVEEDVEIADPGFAAAAMRGLREPGTGMVTSCDGAVVVLAREALPYVRLDDGSAASAAELARRATAQLRAHGMGTQELGIACNRPGAAHPPRPAPATGVGLCTICGEPLPVPGAGDGHAIVACRGCGVGVTIPEPDREIESDGIWEEQYGGSRLLHRAQWMKESGVRLDWVARHRASGTRKLGGVASVVPTVDAWARAHPDRTVDVVTLFHVLEHVHEPGRFLAGIHGILAPDGLLFLEVPNFGSAVARRDPVAWTGTAISDHVLHYTGASLERLLGDTGFRVLERTPLPTMLYDDPSVWAERCRGWRAAGQLAPPEDLLRVLAVPAGA
jgi:SAM-dependent methyltransferase